MWPLNRRFGGARLTLPFLSLSLCCAGVAVGVLTQGDLTAAILGVMAVALCALLFPERSKES